MIRILHINSYFKTNSVHLEFVRALAGFGFKQRVFFPTGASRSAKRLAEQLANDAYMHEIPVFGGLVRHLWPIKMLLTYRAALTVFKVERPDVIHAHTLITNGLIAYFLKKYYGVPYVVTVRNTDLDVFFRKIPFFSYVGLKVMAAATTVMVLSPVYRIVKLPQYFPVETHGWLYGKIVVIPSGINDGWFVPPAFPHLEQKKSLVFVGRVDENKNLELVIDALRELAGRGVRLGLNVVGDGDQLAYLVEKAKGLNVTFYGRIESQDGVKAVLKKSDILVVPSRRETFGLVYVEALSQGLPIIYTAGQGFDRFFDDGFVGFKVSASDPKELAEALLKAYGDYEALSKRAVEAAKQFRWPVVAEKVSDLYRSALSSS